MTIDNCPHTFKKLADEVLSELLAELQKDFSSARSATIFSDKKKKPEALRKELGLEKKAGGLYVFLKSDKPFYVGITRNLLARLRSHVTGKTHFAATLAFKMAHSIWEKNKGEKLKRADLMKKTAFKALFNDAKSDLVASTVAYVVVDDPVTLYLLEVFVAMDFDTKEWNTFRTH